MTYITGHDRSQLLLLPEAVDDYVGSDNPVRFIEAFVDGLDLAAAGFRRVEPSAQREAIAAAIHPDPPPAKAPHLRRIRTWVKYGMTIPQVAELRGADVDEIERILRKIWPRFGEAPPDCLVHGRTTIAAATSLSYRPDPSPGEFRGRDQAADCSAGP